MSPAEFKRRRNRLGFTQAQLAARLGVTENTVGRWEIGLRRIPEMAVRLLETLQPEGKAKKRKR